MLYKRKAKLSSQGLGPLTDIKDFKSPVCFLANLTYWFGV